MRVRKVEHEGTNALQPLNKDFYDAYSVKLVLKMLDLQADSMSISPWASQIVYNS